jgi:hypothetical protein
MIVTIGQTVFADSQTQFSAMLLEIALASLILELQKYLSPPVLILAKNGQYKQKNKIHLQGWAAIIQRHTVHISNLEIHF